MSNITVVEPCEGWVLVRESEVAETTAGGIIKPVSVIEAEQKRGGDFPPTFTVVAIPDVASLVGDADAAEQFRYPSVDDRVLVSTRSGTVLKCGSDCFLVQLACIVAVVRS